MKIQGCTAIVTGAASGMGAALASAIHQAGAAGIVIADLDFEGAGAVARSIGDTALAVHTDVADPTSIDRLVETTITRFGRIDLFVSNAGLTVTGGFEASDDDWRRALDVNLMAHVYAARAVLPHMIANGGGHLLQNTAAAGVLVAFGAAPYSVAKQAAVAFAEYLAVHYGRSGIGVSCLLPQAVNTPMLTAGIASDEDLATLKSISEVLEPDTVAQAALAGIERNAMHIYTHAGTSDSFRRRAEDPDAWIREMADLRFGSETPKQPDHPAMAVQS